jgi:hypothetical protein
MRTFSAILLLAASAVPGVSQFSRHSEPRHLAFECLAVAETASAYLDKHGTLTTRLETSLLLSVFRGGRQPWTDAQGNKISDFKVYWTYADRKTGDRLPFGAWRLRLDHYAPMGEMKLDPDGRLQSELQAQFFRFRRDLHSDLS